MDQLQEKELEQREKDRAQGSRITALHIAMQTRPGQQSTEFIIDEAKNVLKFIEEKNS